MSTTLDPPDEHVPCYWGGALALLASPRRVRYVLGALAASLSRDGWRDDEDRRLVRAHLSLDGPRGDRVLLDAEQGGHPRSLRSFVEGLRDAGFDPDASGLSPWVDGLRPDLAGSFEIEPAEFMRRAMPHYHGFLHAWTDERTARARYMAWAPRDRAEFAHEYLAYAENDAEFARRTGTEATAGLQEAARWLRSQRRYVMRWTLLLREAPAARPGSVGAVGAELLDAARALHESLADGPGERFARGRLEAALGANDEAAWALGALLRRVGLPRGRRNAVRVWEALEESFRYAEVGTEGREALDALRSRLDAAARWMW